MAEINFDDMPEQFRSLFLERDGQYTLDAQKLGEFQKNSEDVRRALSARDNEKRQAEELRKQLAEIKEKIGDFDPNQLPAAMEAQKRIEELEHQQLIAEKKFEEAAERKYQRQVAEMKRQIDALNEQMSSSKYQYEQVLKDLEEATIVTQLSQELIAAGAEARTVPFIVESLRKGWELDPETRKAVPVEYIDNGRTKVTAMGGDGKPLTFKSHATTFLQENPWAAQPSNGANASHQNGSNSSNPFRITESEARDFSRYKAVRDRAEKAGAEIEIVAG
jgi:Tfp pilus assembly protein PilO